MHLYHRYLILPLLLACSGLDWSTEAVEGLGSQSPKHKQVGLGLGLGPNRPPFAAKANSNVAGDLEAITARNVFNVVDFGAEGNGKTDDTAAIGRAFAALAGNVTGSVYFPTGQYVLGSTLTIPKADQVGPFSIRGDGPSSILVWTQDEDMIVFASKGQVSHLLMQDLLVASTTVPKSSTSAAIRFTGGVVQSQLSQLNFIGEETVGTLDTVQLGSCLDLGNVTDTVSLRDVVVWGHTGDAVRIGRGSEVRVAGGRFVAFNKSDDSVGIHLTGNNGGVHVWSTDLIGGHIGMLIDASSGAGSNREIFLTHATLDSNWRGLAIADDSYVSVAGCWTASSDQDNIWVSPESSNAQLVIAGGTIFNAGAEGGTPSSEMCNGIVVNSGSFQITGTSIRNNKGRGIWVPNDDVSDYVISGCRIFGNGQGVDLAGEGYVVTSNTFRGNANTSNFGTQAGGAVVNSNANPTA